MFARAIVRIGTYARDGFMNIAKYLPPVLVDPVKHPLGGWVANKVGMTIVRAAAGAVAFPVVTSLLINQPGPDKPVPWQNLIYAGVTGAVLGGVVGTFFPLTACKQLDRWGALRTGVLDGLWGGPVSGAALALAGKLLGWLHSNVGPANALEGIGLVKPKANGDIDLNDVNLGRVVLRLLDPGAAKDPAEPQAESPESNSVEPEPVAPSGGYDVAWTLRLLEPETGTTPVVFESSSGVAAGVDVSWV